MVARGETASLMRVRRSLGPHHSRRIGDVLTSTSLLSFALLFGACRDSSKPAERSSADDHPAASAEPAPVAQASSAPLGGDRPLAYLSVPKSYDARKPSPLVLVLHGYGSNGAQHAAMFDLGSVPEQERLIVMAPDGLIDSRELRFWNAVPACCDFEGKKPDDVAYLRGLVAEAKRRYSIDPKRVYVVGHSNGGAMALRLACDAADVFAAAMDLAGPFYPDIQASCHPSEPVSVRIVHGTADTVVPFAGGPLPGVVHPNAPRFTIASARAKADGFAAVLGCRGAPAAGPDLDVDLALAGPETKVLAWSGCKAGAAVELWSVTGMGHAPRRVSGWRSAWDFLAAHAKK